jgi:hypothetical protein
MAAPKGNQFWKLRSKHGRDKLFATPDLLWQAACEYFEWCDKHPWYKSEAIKNGKSVGEIVKIPTERPYSLMGFLVYIGTSPSYWYDFKAANHIDFSCVISEIEKIIETQQFEGAAVGAFNANIISRKLGLIDKQNISTPEGEAINIRSTIDTHRIIFENYDNEKEE